MTTRMAMLAQKKRQRRRRIVLVTVPLLNIALASALLVTTLRILANEPASQVAGVAEPPDIVLYIAEDVEDDVLPLVGDFQAERLDIHVQLSGEGCNTFIDSSPPADAEGSIKLILYLPPLLLKVGNREVPLRPSRSYWLCSDLEDDRIRDLAGYLESRLSRLYPETTMNIVGDIIPGRNVARRMAERGTLYPFEKVAPYVCGADVVFADLECPLSDRFRPPYKGVEFIAPQSTIEGLKACGINIVSLANNHSTNFGTQAFTDTLELLKSNQIAYVGGGINSQEAYATRYFKAGGCKFAFLSFNAIAGSINATEGRPGVAWFDMPPYAADDPQDIATMQDAVRRAKAESDFVIVGFHWSVEYQVQPSSSMRNAAHAACDAGADMVIGSHPHIMQPIEYYDGSLIAYNLGNFVFDQMWAEYTREGYMLRCRMKGNLLTDVELVPYRICDYCQPNVLEQGTGQYLLDRLLSISNIAAN